MRAAITKDGYLRLTAEDAKETVDLKRVAMDGHWHLVVKGSRQTRKEHTQVDFQVSLINWRKPRNGLGWPTPDAFKARSYTKRVARPRP